MTRREMEVTEWRHNYLAAALSIVFELVKGAPVRHVWPRP
jgi:hypothetical protein